MELSVSESFAITTAVLQALVVLVLSYAIHKTAQKLNVSENEKKLISRTGFIFLSTWFLLALTLALLDALHVSPNLISPGVPLFFIGIIYIGLKVVPKWKYFEQLLNAFPQHWIFLLHVPRVFGIAFLWLMAQGLLPALFAIPSAFGDIIAGLSGILVAYWYWRKNKGAQKLAIVWNYFGILDLFIAIVFGIFLSFPAPLQIIQVQTTTEIMTVFPMVLVPTFAVPLGLILHFYSLKALQKKK